jgi:hypothetical protein
MDNPRFEDCLYSNPIVQFGPKIPKWFSCHREHKNGMRTVKEHFGASLLCVENKTYPKVNTKNVLKRMSDTWWHRKQTSFIYHANDDRLVHQGRSWGRSVHVCVQLRSLISLKLWTLDGVIKSAGRWAHVKCFRSRLYNLYVLHITQNKKYIS